MLSADQFSTPCLSSLSIGNSICLLFINLLRTRERLELTHHRQDLCHFSAALCLCFSKDLLSYVYSALRHEIYASRTFTLDKVCDKRSFTDLLFFSVVTALASASYSREFRDLSTTAQASALLAVVSYITSICLKRGLADSEA